MGLYGLVMLKSGKAGTQNDDQTKILEPKTVTRGIMWSTRTPMMKVRLISWFYRKLKLNNMKGKKRKNKFITNMIFTN